MNEYVYIIWEQVSHPQIRDHEEVYGYVRGTYEEAQAVVDKLNENDADGRDWRPKRFRRQEVSQLTLKNCLGAE